MYGDPRWPSAHITWVGRLRTVYRQDTILCWPLTSRDPNGPVVGPPPRVIMAIWGLQLRNQYTGRDGRRWRCKGCGGRGWMWTPLGDCWCRACFHRRGYPWWLGRWHRHMSREEE